MYDGNWGSVLWFRARTDCLEIHERTHHWSGEDNTYIVSKIGVGESLEYEFSNVVDIKKREYV